MTNISTKRPKIPIRVKRGMAKPNLMDKLNIPDIEITKFKAYQHRTKEWRDAGYYDGRITESGRIYVHRHYNVIIKGFPAWRIGFKNRYKLPVDIEMNFTVHDKYGLVGNLTKTYRNLRPGEPAEIFVVQEKRKTRLKLETIHVYTGHQPLYEVVVDSFLPPRTWSLLKSFFIVFFMGLYAAAISGGHKDIPRDEGAAIAISVFAFFIASWEIFNITPVMFMFLLLLLIPFSLSAPGEIVILMSLGCLYLWSVWKKRYSIKDFLIGAFTAEEV